MPFELAWTVDFLAGARLIGMASYMFDPGLPLYLRALSLYHVALPPVMVFLLYGRGFSSQTATKTRNSAMSEAHRKFVGP